MMLKTTLFCVAINIGANSVLADDLPPGVPRVVGTNGNTVFVQTLFTTKKYNEEALNWMLQEATDVAARMKLDEDLPITRSNLFQCVISPFGYAFKRKRIGTITTSNYWYAFTQSNRFSEVTDHNVDEACRTYRRGQLFPISQLDTNKAYQIASQLLASASMNVAALNRDCTLRIEPNHYWNGVGPQQPFNISNFVPIYDVFWIAREPAEGHKDWAWVEYYAPGTRLIDLCVYDAKYILRKPFEITNLADVFPGNARVFTNSGQLKFLPKGP